MKVVALEPGFDGVCVREKGEVFEWPHSEPGSWMKVVEKENVAEAQQEQKPEKEKGKKRKNDQEIDQSIAKPKIF